MLVFGSIWKRDRRRRGGARLDLGVLRDLGRAAGADPRRAPRAPPRRPSEAAAREDPDRLGDLAARRRRPGEPRARGGGVPARPRPRGGGRDDGRRAACAEAVPGALDLAADARRDAAPGCGVAYSSLRSPESTSSTRPGCSAGRRPARSLARKPFVAKLTQDPAFERALRRGQFEGDPVEFQTSGSARALRRGPRPRAPPRRACRLPERVPRGHRRVGGAYPRSAISVLPNPTPPLPELPPARHGERPLLVFAGRMTAPKALGVALEAVAEVPEVDFELAGDGDQRAALEARARELGLDGRTRFLGPLSRDEVLALFRRPTRHSFRRRGRTSRTRSSRRSQSARRRSRRRVGGVPEIVTRRRERPARPARRAGGARRGDPALPGRRRAARAADRRSGPLGGALLGGADLRTARTDPGGRRRLT